MKKIFIAALAVALFAAFTLPAYAFESEFGGYWRTRAFTQKEFSGQDDGAQDATRTDSRTRLYYTAKFSENFKFVNKFEFNTTWGDDDGGDIGADGDTFKVKNSYVDFTTGDMNFKVGTQGTVLARGFLFDDDFSGVVATYNAGTVSVPFMWIKVNEEDVDGTVTYFDRDGLTITSDAEADMYAINPTFNVNDNLSVNPFLLFTKVEGEDTNIYFAGANVDTKVGDASVWATLIYEFGEVADIDTTGYLVAAGADAPVDEMISVHGEFFYASAKDDDEDIDAFVAPPGKSYYWSEIMGLGILDNQASAGAPGDAIFNTMAVNAGVTVKPMDKLTVKADVWFAQLVEKDFTANGEDELGTEVDLVATYNIMDNLNLDLVGAYLFAGDATGGGDEDPYELGTRLSFSF